ncbi:MAG: winged helix-turn-helix domain-containing protein [Candidatus Thorarchaeota archaeon]|nr:winged helix-turn-helix domain-containing protein [Candidatus Thorarchaeota archaeon]
MGPDEQEAPVEYKEPASLDELASILSLLGNVTRLRVIAALKEGKMFIQELSQSLGVSYPLLHLHLKNLESNGIVRSEYSVGTDKARRYVKRYFELVDFNVGVDANYIAKLAKRNETDADNFKEK